MAFRRVGGEVEIERPAPPTTPELPPVGLEELVKQLQELVELLRSGMVVMNRRIREIRDTRYVLPAGQQVQHQMSKLTDVLFLIVSEGQVQFSMNEITSNTKMLKAGNTFYWVVPKEEPYTLNLKNPGPGEATVYVSEWRFV